MTGRRVYGIDSIMGRTPSPMYDSVEIADASTADAQTIQRVWLLLDPQQRFASLEDAARNVMQSVALFKQAVAE